MSIRIERIETRIIDHPLREERTVISHAGRHDTSRFMYVTIYGADGSVGLGEAATTALWSGETAETAEWMVRHLFGPLLIGHTFDHPRECLARMDAAAFNNPFAKSAVDTAVWDLWARSQGVRVVDLFKDREPVASIPTRSSVGAYPVEKTLEIAEAFWREGIRTLKFKVGLPGIDDAARLRAVRERLGDAPVFTVDGNGAYPSVASAVTAIEAMLPYNVTLVEQPTPRDRIGMLAEVRRRVNVPIVADECIFTPDHLAAALDLDAFDVLSIYPGKNGGFTHALEMARTAQRAGKQCAIGSNLETDIGQAAMASLAAGLAVFPVEEIACDLPAVMYYRKSAATPPLEFREGRVAVPTGSGFGVALVV
jgi:muconate cycloisomerase